MTWRSAKNASVPAVRAQRAAASPIDPDTACLDAFQRELDYIDVTLRRLGTAPSDVEDLMQEVFLALHRAWPRLDHTRPLRPYLFGIAFRVAAAHWRKHRREVPFGGLDILTDQTVSPDVAMEGRQARGLLLAALDRVPLARRAVLLMHELDEVPVAEIASVLAIPRFTVYARLRKGRRELAAAVRRLLTRTSGEVVAITLPARAHVSGQASWDRPIAATR